LINNYDTYDPEIDILMLQASQQYEESVQNEIENPPGSKKA
jgi:hypothetical protein